MLTFYRKQCKPEYFGTTSLKCWKKVCQPKILYPEKIFFRNEAKIKICSGKENLGELITQRSAQEENL